MPYVTVPVLCVVSVGDPSLVDDDVTESVPCILIILHVWSVGAA